MRSVAWQFVSMVVLPAVWSCDIVSVAGWLLFTFRSQVWIDVEFRYLALFCLICSWLLFSIIVIVFVFSSEISPGSFESGLLSEISAEIWFGYLVFYP